MQDTYRLCMIVFSILKIVKNDEGISRDYNIYRSIESLSETLFF